MSFKAFIGVLALLAVATVAEAQPEFLLEEMVDLTHAVEKGMPEDAGTHVDAPRRFERDKKAIDQLLPGDMVANAMVINVVEEARRNPDYELTLEDLRKWEAKNGPIKKNSIVILRTGWESKWFKPKEYLNKDKRGVMHWPGFSCDVVDYLAHNRAVRALGTDTLSIDPGRSPIFCAHQVLLHTNKYTIEGLTNLEKLPPRGAVIVVAPMKIKAGSGAPARVFAWVP